MSLAIVYSRAQLGIQSPLVTVEVHLSRGLPSLSIVGLAETAVKESKDRVRSAILNNDFEFPLKRITINLAPADLPKAGGRYDLAIAIGILAASGQIANEQLERYEFLGELALSGSLRAIKGTLPAAMATKRTDRCLIIPTACSEEAALVNDLTVYQADHLQTVCNNLSLPENFQRVSSKVKTNTRTAAKDLAEVQQQHQAKRALEIAAAGGHSLLMIGPPGTGKTMLAERLIGILPELTEQQALETAAIASISHTGFDPQHWQQPPFRSPHHTASAVALVGGGGNPKPGEISLAHNGVLFLDELPEFSRHVLEVLREPLESGRICISRAGRQAEFPAEFQLIAAMNPCNCGYLGDDRGQCQCTEDQIIKYRNRISGPLLDRIDLHVNVPNITHTLLKQNIESSVEDSHTVKNRVVTTRAIQQERSNTLNAKLTSQQIKLHCELNDEQTDFLQNAIDKLNLSTRGLHRILKVARTIADLAEEERIAHTHLAEAIHFRMLDRK